MYFKISTAARYYLALSSCLIDVHRLNDSNLTVYVISHAFRVLIHGWDLDNGQDR